MESISTRKVGLAFLAALLAFALMPFTGLAYADTPAGEAELSDTEATEEAAPSEPSSDAVPEASPAPSETHAQNTASSDGIDLRGPADATVANFAELQAAISAITGDADPTGTIIIDGDFSFDSMIEVTVPCVITIQGGNHTLTATAARHFQFTGGANVTITDAVFDGGTTAGGINVLNGGELALERTTMQNCSAPSGQGGGALRTYGNTVALAVKVTISDNCVFKDNIANALNPHNAGALEIRQNTTFAMSDSSFERNTARGVGGAVYVIGAAPTQMADATFTNVTFDRNESLESQGGGIAIKDYANVVFDRCSFTNNKAYSSGGGLFTDRYCDITIKDSEFLNNTASGSYYASAGGLGVGLYNHAITRFTMTGTTVTETHQRTAAASRSTRLPTTRFPIARSRTIRQQLAVAASMWEAPSAERIRFH